jgi:small subunit ribosomal protein S16
MQRTGRKGFATFRVVVQDSRFAPSSGRVVAKIGHYNPHTKETVIDKEQASEFLKQGAQPSPRVVRLLTEQKVALPDWVELKKLDKKRKIRNPEKLRKNQPKVEPVAEPETEEPTVAETSVESPEEVAATEEAVVEEAEATETAVEETPAEA